MTENKCIFDSDELCNECNECILCYKCIYCRERFDEELQVLCEQKGKVDVHSVCFVHKRRPNKKGWIENGRFA